MKGKELSNSLSSMMTMTIGRKQRTMLRSSATNGRLKGKVAVVVSTAAKSSPGTEVHTTCYNFAIENSHNV